MKKLLLVLSVLCIGYTTAWAYELGQGLGPQWPTALDTHNIPETASTKAYYYKFNDLADTIIQVENELGLNPRGVYPTVKARLDSVASTLTQLGIDTTTITTNYLSSMTVMTSVFRGSMTIIEGRLIPLENYRNVTSSNTGQIIGNTEWISKNSTQIATTENYRIVTSSNTGQIITNTEKISSLELSTASLNSLKFDKTGGNISGNVIILGSETITRILGHLDARNIGDNPQYSGRISTQTWFFGMNNFSFNAHNFGYKEFLIGNNNLHVPQKGYLFSLGYNNILEDGVLDESNFQMVIGYNLNHYLPDSILIGKNIDTSLYFNSVSSAVILGWGSPRLYVSTGSVTVTNDGDRNNGISIIGIVGALPASGYYKGTFCYLSSDNTVYVSTETVRTLASWKPVW